MHWSLCVIVNPGALATPSDDGTASRSNGEAEEKPFPCLLFFDSLKAHQKKTVLTKVRGWLNAEWDRLHSEVSGSVSISEINIYSPKSEFMGASHP